MVDLTGWRLTRGLTCDVNNNPTGSGWLSGDCGGCPRLDGRARHQQVLGNYNGQLSNNGELIRLEDAWGNLVDEVDYKVGGEWPESPNGGGSSLELTHPLDNGFDRLASQRRKRKIELAILHIQRSFRRSRTFGGTTDYKEI